jgi:hypothetical protein
MAGHDHEHDQEREAQAAGARKPPAAAPADRMRDLAVSIGNAAFGRLARHGAGLLPGGRVHDGVEQAISARRGGGRALDDGTRARVGEALGDPLADVRVHDDADAAGLARSVSARAFTTGSDVFFGDGEYRPGTAEGDQLLAHELTHVVQQRGAPTSGPLEVSEPGDALEQEAEAAARDISGP